MTSFQLIKAREDTAADFSRLFEYVAHALETSVGGLG